MAPDLAPPARRVRWSWPWALALIALACIVASVLAGASDVETAVVTGGVTLATIGIARHVIGTWRVGHSV